jgi:hypothetical protein
MVWQPRLQYKLDIIRGLHHRAVWTVLHQIKPIRVQIIPIYQMRPDINIVIVQYYRFPILIRKIALPVKRFNAEHPWSDGVKVKPLYYLQLITLNVYLEKMDRLLCQIDVLGDYII